MLFVPQNKQTAQIPYQFGVPIRRGRSVTTADTIVVRRSISATGMKPPPDAVHRAINWSMTKGSFRRFHRSKTKTMESHPRPR